MLIGRWLGRDALALALMALAFELILRLAAPIYQTQITDQDLTIGYPRAVNEDDYRGPIQPRHGASGERRIIALGDSVTFGIGVAEDQTWSAQLQRHLFRAGQPKVTVINGGYEGASLSDLSYAFKKKWRDYDGDRIILAVTGNMISLGIAHKDEKAILPAEHFAPFRAPRSLTQRLSAQINRTVHRLCLPSFLSLRSQQAFYWLGVLNHNLDPAAPYGALLAHGYKQGDLDPDLAQEGWDLFKVGLQKFAAMVKASGKSLSLLYITPRFSLSDDLADNAKNIPLARLTMDPVAIARGISDSLGIPFIDGSAALKSARRAAHLAGQPAPELYLLLDYVHLDAAGHQAIAAEVATRFAGQAIK